MLYWQFRPLKAELAKKKIEKKINRFLKSENMCFFINSPTFPVLFPFLVYTGG